MMMSNHYRYERKFLIEDLHWSEIESYIKFHPSNFSEIFYQRFINNLYFDTVDMSSYWDNVDGVKDRQKFRMRWYGDLFGYIEKPTLEVKKKRGIVGTKESYPLLPCTFEENLDYETIQKSINKSLISRLIKLKMNWLQLAW